jgi:subtilase family serine protease
MAPADLATIYDFNPLFHGSHPITGLGQTIAVAEDSDLYSNGDWTNFRRIFGLEVYRSGSLHTVHPTGPHGSAPCRDPGVNANGDDVETALDAEWASAAAPDASILVVNARRCGFVGGLTGAV